MISSRDRREVEGSTETRSGQQAARRRGVLLINLGTPDGPDVESVRRYLAEFLGDPAVIRLPWALRWLNPLLGRLIARFRAPKSATLYRKIWSERGSPLGSITAEQASVLRGLVPPDWQVFHAMRYGEPSIGRTLAAIEEAGIEELVVIPMYPQFSEPTTGTAVKELYRCLQRGGHHLSVTVRNAWYDDGGYVNAQAKLIHEYATAHGLRPDNALLVFSAHGLPVSYAQRGDPYPQQVRRSIELIAHRLGWPADRMRIAYQSRMGPAKWLEPAVDELLVESARHGEKQFLICPVSFTVDCLETLEEIDLRYRKMVEDAGADLFLCPALNTFAPFIAALKNLALRGRHPVTASNGKVKPLFSRADRSGNGGGHAKELVMIGVSKSGRIASSRGPRILHSTDAGLCKTKRNQCGAVPLLKEICADGGFSGGFIWNTCHRFEFYGWLDGESNENAKQAALAEARRKLLGDELSDGLHANVLRGAEAWHHLARTAVGLNSGLPGDRDVLEQLATAGRVAERAGTDSEETMQLIARTLQLESTLREQTSWGRFDTGFCQAALARVADAGGLTFADLRCSVFGGSTTSRSVLTALSEKFEVPSRTLTLVYRGHGSGQMKLLRKAIGNGKRVRVQSYTERGAVDVVAEADVIVLGLDTDRPVLSAERIRDLRDFTQRPLTIIDFNTFGSTSGMDGIAGVTVYSAGQLDAEVAAFAEALCGDDDFAEGVREAEDWIARRAREHAPTAATEPALRVGGTRAAKRSRESTPVESDCVRSTTQ